MLTGRTALEPDQIDRIFSNQLLEDPQDFAQYVLQTFTHHIKKKDRGGHIAIDHQVLLRKLDSAIDAFQHSEHEDAKWSCVQVHLLLLGEVLPRHNRLLAQDEVRKLSIKSRDAIYAALEEGESDRGWFDYADLRGELWRSYKISASGCRKYAGTNCTECWHTDHFPLLAKLNKLARRDTGWKVYMAAGRRLPQELVDQVLESSFQAEEVTADISMRPDDGCTNSYWHIVKNLSHKYRCRVIKKLARIDTP